MKCLKLYLILLPVTYVWASKCGFKAKKLNCTCEEEQYPEGSDFTANCVNGSVNLKYENGRNYFQVTCKSALSISDTLLEHFLTQDENVQDIKFQGCTLPNTTFPKPLYDINFKKLLIVCEGRAVPHQNWSAVMLQKLNYMEELLIQGCPTSFVPEDLLQFNPSLSKLYLEENGIQTLPVKLLQNVTRIGTLSLMKNEIQYINDTFFQYAAALEDLNLKKNNLSNISLTGLKTLKKLDLSFNQLTDIPQDMFSDNSLLINLNLGWNKILKVTTRPFKNLVNLRILNMGNNSNDISLPTGFLEGLEKLRNLTLSDCHMTKPPADLLNWTRNLENLELGNNRIEEFPPGFFQHQNKLEILDLTFNDLTENISENTFQGLKNLQYLSLRKNNFSIFPDNILKPLSQLTVLHLEENFLEELDMQGQSVPFLKELILTQNQISVINEGFPFGDRSGLQVVDLSRNNLTRFNVYLVTYNLLRTLDLSYNHFPIITLPAAYSTNNLNVFLTNCSIETVDCSILDMSPIPKNGRYTQYILERNPLLCNCRQLKFQESLQNRPANFPERQSLTCRTISNKNYTPILSLRPEDFICETDRCPDMCVCSITAENVTILDCQGKGVRYLSELMPLPQNVSVLKLQRNNLTSISDINQQKWENVTELYADDNQIKSEDWTLPKHLRTLSLTRNYLTWFPKSLVAVAQQKDGKLGLGYNPWDCNCSAWDFHNEVWASSLSNLLDSQSIVCATPEKANGLSISSWEGNVLCPTKSSWPSIVAPILICVFIALTLPLLVVCYFRNRQTFIAYLFTHWPKIFIMFFAEKDLDEDRHFHAFVAYSSDDSHIVEALLRQLENKPPHYKLCIHERDWLPGNPIIWNIVNSVQNSRRTILIVSKQFIKSMWFQLEYSIAYHQMLEDKVDRLIVIVNGDKPDPSEMDEELSFLMSTKTYLVWGERWFWEKMKYALPHPKINRINAPRPAKERPNNGLIRKIEDKILTIASETLQSQTAEAPKAVLSLKRKCSESRNKLESGMATSHV